MIKTLTLKNFRLYNEETLACHPKLNIIVGNNAQGKTSLLEAIHVLGLTKSHKTHHETHLITHGAEYAKIEALITRETKEVQLSLVLSKLGKKAKYNRLEVKRLSDYIGSMHVVMFAPEDLDLIKGGPLERRMFLDLEIGQLQKPYLYFLSHYKRLLKERNEVLKTMQRKQSKEDPLLDVITEQLAHYAEKIRRERAAFIENVNERIQPIYKHLSDDDPPLTIRYEPSIKGDMLTAYQKKQGFDILTGTTSLGPHRDDFSFYLSDIPVKTVASQGQIRTVALSTMLTLVKIIEDTKNTPPIVLLDDVFSELDRKRQMNLLEYLHAQSQIFISTTDINHLDTDALNDYQVVEVDNGQIKGVTTYGSKDV